MVRLIGAVTVGVLARPALAELPVLRPAAGFVVGLGVATAELLVLRGVAAAELLTLRDVGDGNRVLVGVGVGVGNTVLPPSGVDVATAVGVAVASAAVKMRKL